MSAAASIVTAACRRQHHLRLVSHRRCRLRARRRPRARRGDHGVPGHASSAAGARQPAEACSTRLRRSPQAGSLVAVLGQATDGELEALASPAPLVRRGRGRASPRGRPPDDGHRPSPGGRRPARRDLRRRRGASMVGTPQDAGDERANRAQSRALSPRSGDGHWCPPTIATRPVSRLAWRTHEPVASEQARALMATEVAFVACHRGRARVLRLFVGLVVPPPALAADGDGSHLLAVGCRRRGWGTSCSLWSCPPAVLASLVTPGSRTAHHLVRPAHDASPGHAMSADLERRLDPVRRREGAGTGRHRLPGRRGHRACGSPPSSPTPSRFRARRAIEAIVPSRASSSCSPRPWRPDRLPPGSCTALWLARPARLRAAPHDGSQDERQDGWPARRGTGRLGHAHRRHDRPRVVVAAGVGARPRACRAPARSRSSIDTGNGSGTRQTLSPLVDIQGRIVDRSDLEAFTVLADGQRYWRLTALDEFDGRIWSSERRLRRRRRRAPDGGRPDAADTVPSTRRSPSRPSTSIWLPAAFAPDAHRHRRQTSATTTSPPAS